MTALALVALWPHNMLAPTQGLDPSHGAAMAMASQKGLRFGVQILFTYGPLGFLHVPTLYFGRTALLSELFILFLEAFLLFGVARNMVRSFGPFLGFLLFAVVGMFAIYPLLGGFVPEMGILMVALLALEWIHPAPPGPGTSVPGDVAVSATLAALSGLLFLVKFDTGLLALIVLGLACAVRALPDGGDSWTLRQGARRFLTNAASGVAGFLIAVVAFWLAAGQRLEDLPAYVRGSLRVAEGYSSAMSIEDPSRHWEYGAAALVALVLMALGSWAGIRQAKSWKRIGPVLIMALLAAAFFKEGFVRHDGHSLIFFAGLLIAASALWRWIPRPVGVVAVVASIPLLVHMQSAWARPSTLLEGPGRAAEITRGLLAGATRAEIEGTARASLRSQYGVPPADVVLMSGHTVHIDPWEASVAWAYPEFVWDPAPVFQIYSAYTAALDRMNADFLASDAAPEYILRANEAIDGRDAQWESPDYVLEMMCRYRQVDRAGGWQVLQRIPSRCGTPVPLGVVPSNLGKAVTLPPAIDGNIEVARMSLGTSRRQALGNLLYKDGEYFVDYAGQRSRFVTGTAGSEHVLAVPSCLEWSPEFLPARGQTIRISRDAQTVESARDVVVSAASVALRCGS